MSDNFSIESLIVWLEKQPADKAYDYHDASNCLLGQWCASMGLEGEDLKDKSINLGEDDDFFDIALEGDYTFGAALVRARNELSRAKFSTNRKFSFSSGMLEK
jgi:hypothetical protein